jgi:hypothetical protein
MRIHFAEAVQMTLTAFVLAVAAFSAVNLESSKALPADLRGLDGEWVFVEDLTEGRALEQLGPPMSSTFAFGVEEGAVILVSGHGSGQKNVRINLDGSPTEVIDGSSLIRYTGSWIDETFTYQSDYFKGPERTPDGFIKKSFRQAVGGLIVTVTGRFGESTALYKHPQDIAMPTPFKATISDLSWMVGNWVGSRGTNNSIGMEERWSPAKGGSMLAISRTVSREKMSAFEYLRILERDGGLVYIAQPNGGTATEFVLTELTGQRAVFDNPRHDYPKRITYELSADGVLTATIGQLKGGTPRKFEFKREQ